MQEPFRRLYGGLVLRGWEWNGWRYSVKRVTGAFYIGDNNEHITVLERYSGFHHSFNSSEGHRHMTRSQHRAATTLEDIIYHIQQNPGAYLNAQVIVTALVYIEDNYPSLW